jgi:hypothetical protein
MKKYTLIAISAVLFFAQSCVTPTTIAKRGDTRIVVMETIPQTSLPKWANSTKEFWEGKDAYYYRGVGQGYTDPEVAKQDAEAIARASLARQIKLVLREEFSKALEAQKHDPLIGGYLSDAFVSAVENLEVSGSVLVESYSLRIQEESHKTVLKDYWRTYALVKLPKGEYEKCSVRAFQNLKEQVQANESAKDLAEQTEKRFWDSQETEE